MTKSSDLKALWDTVLPLLTDDLTKVAVDTWFKEVEPVELDGNRFVITTPSEFKANMIRTRYLPSLKKVLFELFATDIDVTILNADELKKFQSETDTSNQNVLMGSEEYTFDRFVVGSSNRFAYNAAKAVAHAPGKSYNPLFLYGESGLGKTHLLYAIYHAICSQHPDYQIIYVKGDEFTNELMTAIGNNSTEAFRLKYRDKDLLLVDDIQFIAGKNSTQEEFFNTFNNLYEAGKQIVLTSDRPPSDMPKLEDRLRTRFECGLMADIQPPDYETRCAIIRNKAILLGLNMPSSVIEYIAQNITANVRQLEGTINRLLAYRDLEGNDVDGDGATRAIRELIRAKDEFTPSLDLIVEMTAKYYDLDSKQIMGSSRKANIVMARQISMYIMRTMTGQSLPEIGKFFNQHHTTVMHSVEKIEQLQQEDRELSHAIKDIKANINSRTY
jgi:chromosomal replication initiator protein